MIKRVVGVGGVLLGLAATRSAILPRADSSKPPLFGFYSAGLSVPSCWDQCSDPKARLTFQHDLDRIHELRQLHIDFIANLDFKVSSYDTPEHARAFDAFVDSLRANGISWSIKLTGQASWFDPALGLREGRHFNPAQALRILAATDRNGDGVSDLDGQIGAVWLSHEVLEYATHAERVQMYRVGKRFFPHTPVVHYYGGAAIFLRPFQQPNMRHPRGGRWGDYAFGPGETDFIHVALPAPFRNDTGTPAFDLSRTRALLGRVLAVRDSVTPGLPLITHASFAIDDGMRRNPATMWSAAALQQYLDLLDRSQVQGILLRSYGRFRYDLGFRNPEKDPSLPKGGWETQRQVVRKFGLAIGH